MSRACGKDAVLAYFRLSQTLLFFVWAEVVWYGKTFAVAGDQTVAETEGWCKHAYAAFPHRLDCVRDKRGRGARIQNPRTTARLGDEGPH